MVRWISQPVAFKASLFEDNNVGIADYNSVNASISNLSYLEMSYAFDLVMVLPYSLHQS